MEILDDPADDHLRRVLGVRSVRLRILRELVRAGEASAGDIMAVLGLSRNGVRKHLRDLELAGLVSSTVERRGPTRSVRVWTPARSRISDFIDDVDLYLLGSSTQQISDHLSDTMPA